VSRKRPAAVLATSRANARAYQGISALDHGRHLARLRDGYETHGYRSPLLTAVVYCERFKLPIPAWARLALAKAFAVHLGFWNSDKWTLDASGCVLGRKQKPRRPPFYSTLDRLLGITGRNPKDISVLTLNEYVEKFESGKIPTRKQGYRSSLESIATKSQQLNDIAQVRHIQTEARDRGEPVSEKAAAYALVERRGQGDPAKFYQRFKQYKYAHKPTRR